MAFKKLREAIEASGYDLKDINKVLDWGCGCGRVMRHWQALAHRIDLHGCDIHPGHLQWCNQHFTFGTFEQCALFAALPYDAECFDLVYGISVTTHLSLRTHLLWMQELWRVITADGIAIITFYGPSIIRHHLNSSNHKYEFHLVDEHPFIFLRNGDEGSNSCISVTDVDAMKRIFFPFQIAWYRPRHDLMGGQDTLVLRKTRGASILALGDQGKEPLTLRLSNGQAQVELRVRITTQRNLFAFVRKPFGNTPFRARASIMVGTEVRGSNSISVPSPEEFSYHTLSVNTKNLSAGSAIVRLEVECNGPSQLGEVVCFEYTFLS